MLGLAGFARYMVAHLAAVRIAVAVVLASTVCLFSAAADACSVTITSAPANPTNSTEASFSFSQTGCHSGGFQCKLDGGSYASCSSPKVYSSLSEGGHTFTVRWGGFGGETDSHPWTIDTTAPNTTITSGPPDYTNDPKPTWTFTSNEAGTFECRLDGAAWAACASPYTPSLLTNEAHRFDVRAKDQVGNYDATPDGQTFEVGRPGGVNTNAMWVLTSDDIGTWLLLETVSQYNMTMSTANMMTHAVDLGGDNYWVFAWDATLRSYSVNPLSEKQNITPPTTPGGGDTVSLGVDFSNGNAFVSFATKLYQYADDGTLVRTTTFGNSSKALAVDSRNSQTIVALSNSIVAIDSVGGGTNFTVNDSGAVEISVDQNTGEFWAVFPGAAKQYSSSGSALVTASITSGAHVAVDGIGGAWVAAGGTLYAFDASGSQRLSLSPFAGATISSVAADPFYGSVWVSSGSDLRHYSTSGSLLDESEANATVKSILLSTVSRMYASEEEGAGALVTGTNDVWTVADVWAGSEAEVGGLQVGDEVISINDVAMPGTDATDEELEDFRTDVVAARTGGSDDWAIERDGSPSVLSIDASPMRTQFRHAMDFIRRYPGKAPVPDPDEPGWYEPIICRNCQYSSSGYGVSCPVMDRGFERCLFVHAPTGEIQQCSPAGKRCGNH